MRKQRIIALILSILLTISVSFGRIMPVYADTALTAGAIDVLYGLLGSAGIIAAHEGTNAEKRAATQEIFNNMTAEQQQVFLGGMSGLEYVNTDMTGYKFKNTDTFTYDKSWFYDLAQSAITAIASGFNYVVPDTGTPVADVPNMSDYSLLGTAVDSPIVVINDNGSRHVYGFTSDYKYVDYTVSATGVFSYGSKHLRQCPADAYFRYQIYPSNRPASFVCGYALLGYNAANGGYLFTQSGSCRVGTDGIFYGSANDYKMIGTVDLSGLSLGTVIGTVNPDVNCDEWSQTMSDTIADNKDVIILGGQDLANYDTVDDVRNGIITGVDWTGSTNPDIPVDDGTILGKLDSLIKWLAGLPALIASAIGTFVIGSGSLDFSGLKNIQLSTVFPFCIPYDLVNTFKGFNATPSAPIWTIDFSGTPLAPYGVMVIDLTQYEEVFAILRYFVYAGFVVFLITSTRKLVKG